LAGWLAGMSNRISLRRLSTTNNEKKEAIQWKDDGDDYDYDDVDDGEEV
jgi:hypothetical protein